MRGFIVIIIMINTTLFTLKGQHDPYFSHYTYSITTLNPGAAGSEEEVSLTAITRQQWGDLGPQVSYFNGNMPFELLGLKHGVSFTIDNDQLGFYRNLAIKAGYAYRLELSDGILGLGLSLGAINQELDPEWYVPEKGIGLFTDPSGDPSIPDNAKESVTIFDLGLGVMFKSNDMYLGLASTHLNQGSFRYAKESVSVYAVRHFFMHGGYALSVDKIPSLSLGPSFILGSDLRSTQVVLGLVATYKEKMWGGLKYRVGSAVVGLIGFELFDGVKVGYAYDFETSQIRQYGGGSHELMLRYGFEIVKDKIPEGYRSIRFL